MCGAGFSRAGDLRCDAALISGPQGRRAETVHILTWDGDDNKLLRTSVPLWLMRFSSINILSNLGIAPERFSLTVKDIERYGPGVIVDFRRPGQNRVLLWTE